MNSINRIREILIETASAYEEIGECAKKVASERSRDNREAYEKSLINMYKKSISLNRSSKVLLRDVINRDEIEKITGTVVYDIEIDGGKNAIMITLDGLMLHRKVTVSANALWEKELTDKLSEFVRKTYHSSYEKSVVIYQHVFPKDCKDTDVYDNDNYQQKECKMILDAIVSAGLIKGDKGTDCGIMHTATYGDDYKTLIHVVKESEFARYYETIK